MAILAIGCRGAATPSCPTGAPLEVDLAAWDRAIASADPAASGVAVYDSLLAELGLEPIPNRQAEKSPEDEVITLASVEVAELRRGDGETPDQLVTARFRSAAGAESLRAQLLRPLSRRQGVYCPLGDELSRDKETFEEPCLKRHTGAAPNESPPAAARPTEEGSERTAQ